MNDVQETRHVNRPQSITVQGAVARLSFGVRLLFGMSSELRLYEDHEGFG